MDMGPVGQYQMFGRNGVELGGMYNKPAEMPGPPAWTHYMMVDDIQRAADAAKAGGGQIINGPMEVPGGDWIFQALDPAGRDVRDSREGEEVGRASSATLATAEPEGPPPRQITTRTDRIPEQTGSKRLRNSIAG